MASFAITLPNPSASSLMASYGNGVTLKYMIGDFYLQANEYGSIIVMLILLLIFIYFHQLAKTSSPMVDKTLKEQQNIDLK